MRQIWAALLLCLIPSGLFAQSAPNYLTPMIPFGAGSMVNFGAGMLPNSGPMAPGGGSHSSGPATPTVTAVVPPSGLPAGGTAVVISGTNFTGATGVKFGANAASFTFVSSNTINATSPAGLAGTVDVQVTTPLGTSPINPNDHFLYTTCTNSLDFSQSCNSQYIVAVGF